MPNNRTLPFLLSLSFSCFTIFNTHPINIIKTDKQSLLSATSCTLIAGIASFFNKQISHHPSTKCIAFNTNTDAKDLADYCVLAPFFWGMSYLPNHLSVQTSMRFSILASPLIRIIATSKSWNNLLRYLPLFGKDLICNDNNCQGVCNKCKYRLIYKEAPFTFAIRVPKLINNHLHLKKQITEASTGICTICDDQEDGLVQNLVVPCPNAHGFCFDCINNWCIKNNKNTCPTCRAVVDKTKIIKSK